jgi:flagellar motor switch protein FliN/FliY
MNQSDSATAGGKSAFSPADISGVGAADRPGARSGAAAGNASASGGAGAEQGANLESILRIPVNVQVVLGSAVMPVANLMKLGRGAVIPLDHRVGEPVDVVVNGRIVARGEVVVVEDDNSRFGVSLTEIVGPAGSEA